MRNVAILVGLIMATFPLWTERSRAQSAEDKAADDLSDAQAQESVRKYESKVQNELMKEYACDSRTKGDEKKTGIDACKVCLPKVQARASKQGKEIFDEIKDAFGNRGLGPVLAEAAEKSGKELESSYSAASGDAADHIFLVTSWSQALLSMGEYADKAIAARKDSKNSAGFLKKIHEAFGDAPEKAADDVDDDAVFAKGPFAPVVKAIEKECHDAQNKYDCYTGVLTQIKAQAGYASGKLAEASSKVRWTHTALRYCEDHDTWNHAVGDQLASLSRKPPVGAGSDLLVKAENKNLPPGQVALAGGRSEPEKRTKRHKGEVGAENACVVKFREAKKAGQLPGTNPDDICDVIKGTTLMGFSKDLQHILGDVEGTDYFTALRMQAIADSMEAHKEFVGSYPDLLKKDCPDFIDGIGQIRISQPSERLKSRMKLQNDPDYLKGVSIIARVLMSKNEEAARLDRLLEHPGVSNYNSIDEAKKSHEETEKRRNDIESEINDILQVVPFLQAGHSNGSKIYQDMPMLREFAYPMRADVLRTSPTEKEYRDANSYIEPGDPAFNDHMRGLLEKAKPYVRQANGIRIKKFCSSEEDGGVSWEDLVKREDLTKKVLEKMPVFKMMHECAMEALGTRKAAAMVGNFAVGLGCIPAGMAANAVPGGGVAVGSACLAYFAGDALYKFSKDLEQRNWIAQCIAAGGKVCSAKDYRDALEEYSDALTTLVTTVAATGLAEGPAFIKWLREANELKGLPLAEVKNLTSELKNVKLPIDFTTLQEKARAGDAVAQTAVAAAKAEAAKEFDVAARNVLEARNKYIVEQLAKNNKNPSTIPQLQQELINIEEESLWALKNPQAAAKLAKNKARLVEELTLARQNADKGMEASHLKQELDDLDKGLADLDKKILQAGTDPKEMGILKEEIEARKLKLTQAMSQAKQTEARGQAAVQVYEKELADIEGTKMRMNLKRSNELRKKYAGPLKQFQHELGIQPYSEEADKVLALADKLEKIEGEQAAVVAEELERIRKEAARNCPPLQKSI